jgi:hypothetical protein
MIKLIFCDPHMRELYEDWKTKTLDAVAYLRMVSGQRPGDPRLASLIGELSVSSQEFARLWAGHVVRQCRASVRGLRHPLVGGLTLNEEVMELVQDEGQRLVVYTAEPGSPSEAGLRLLAGLTAEGHGRAAAQAAHQPPGTTRVSETGEWAPRPRLGSSSSMPTCSLTNGSIRSN